MEVKDEVAPADIFVELEHAYEEDIDSHLDEALVLEKHDAIENSCSNVPIGRPRIRKRVKYNETDLGYAPTRNPKKKRKLSKDERYVTDFVDDVKE
nr:hypothetical protein [Tanacetum cinerariifolium]